MLGWSGVTCMSGGNIGTVFVISVFVGTGTGIGIICGLVQVCCIDIVSVGVGR